MKKIKNRLTKKKDMDFTVFEHYECDGQLSIEDIGGIMESIINISAEEIYSHPDNPRKDLGDLTELADSIKKKGIMQNLTVMKGHWDEERNWQQSGYTLLIGHRRFAAGKLAKISEFPCRVVENMEYKEQIWKVLTGLEVGIYRRTMAELFLKKGYWDSEQKDREGADQKAIELSAFGQMLAILNHGLKSDSNSPVGYMAEYKKEKGMLQLEAYRILEVYGWYFTEEEKSLLDGTHELYAKKDNK